MSPKVLREEVLLLLRGEGAHVDFDRVVAGIPARLRGARTRGTPHTLWQLLEHLRIAQWDILEYCRNPGHVSPEFPAGYWPASGSPPDGRAWQRSIALFRRDLRSMQKLIADPKNDIAAPIPHAQGVSLLHEALLLADHNAYHLGQMVYLRRRLGAGKG
jgi:hypothetical protein